MVHWESMRCTMYVLTKLHTSFPNMLHNEWMHDHSVSYKLLFASPNVMSVFLWMGSAPFTALWLQVWAACTKYCCVSCRNWKEVKVNWSFAKNCYLFIAKELKTHLFMCEAAEPSMTSTTIVHASFHTAEHDNASAQNIPPWGHDKLQRTKWEEGDFAVRCRLNEHENEASRYQGFWKNHLPIHVARC